MGVKKMETTQINHAEYMRKVRGLSEESLMYIIRDAQAAIKAMPDGHKAGYYADEIHYCSMELSRRKRNANNRAKNQILRDICGTSARAAREDMGM